MCTSMNQWIYLSKREPEEEEEEEEEEGKSARDEEDGLASQPASERFMQR